MDVQLLLHSPPCSSAASSSFFSRLQLHSPASLNFPKITSQRPLISSKTTPELQTLSVSVTGQKGSTPSVPSHKVTVHDRQRNIEHEFFVPEDQYILHTAASQNISLPFACRHGI